MLRDAISGLNHQASAMELFGALPDAPKEECLRLVRASNIFVGVVGVRYGSIDPQTGKSISELEYQEACSLRLPCLIYMIDEDSHPVLPKHVEVGAGAEKLAHFRAALRKAHVVSTFSSPADLVAKLTRDLIRLLGASNDAKKAEVLAQLARNTITKHPLTEPRFRYLHERMKGEFKVLPPDAILREAFELALAGDNLAASFVLSRGGSMPLDEAVDSLMKFEKIIKDVIERGQARKAANLQDPDA